MGAAIVACLHTGNLIIHLPSLDEQVRMLCISLKQKEIIAHYRLCVKCLYIIVAYKEQENQAHPQSAGSIRLPIWQL
jgi:hypothetical protein